LFSVGRRLVRIVAKITSDFAPTVALGLLI
jgi:hypothetical protein